LLFTLLYRRTSRYTRTDQRNGEALMSTSPANYCLPTQHSFLSTPVKYFGQRNKKGLPTPKLNILKSNKLPCGTLSIKKLRGRLLIIINEAGGLINRLLHAMRIKLLLFTFVLGMSKITSATEVIVCAPVELKYNNKITELSIFAKGGVTSNNLGVVCNQSGSWCKSITVKPGITSKISIQKAELSQPMVFFQTKHNAKHKYGGCNWQVSM
jgi:hypothetical protein